MKLKLTQILFIWNKVLICRICIQNEYATDCHPINIQNDISFKNQKLLSLKIFFSILRIFTVITIWWVRACMSAHYDDNLGIIFESKAEYQNNVSNELKQILWYLKNDMALKCDGSKFINYIFFLLPPHPINRLLLLLRSNFCWCLIPSPT